jgi:hypothetical protein
MAIRTFEKPAQAWYDYLNGATFNWDYFITFTSVESMGANQTEKATKRWFERLHGFNGIFGGERGVLFWVGERYGLNRDDYHIHALYQIPAKVKGSLIDSPDLYKELDFNWQKAMGAKLVENINGSLKFKVQSEFPAMNGENYDYKGIHKNRVNIRRYVQQKGAESYLCKYLFKQTNYPYDLYL